MEAGTGRTRPRFIEFGGGDGYGKWVVEVPEGLDGELFARVVPNIISSALGKCDPEIKLRDTVVQFPERVIFSDCDRDGSIAIARGNNMWLLGKRVISISLGELENICNRFSGARWHLNALQTLSHEVFEENYFALNPTATQTPFTDPNYQNAEHELVADRDALANLEQVTGVEYITYGNNNVDGFR